MKRELAIVGAVIVLLVAVVGPEIWKANRSPSDDEKRDAISQLLQVTTGLKLDDGLTLIEWYDDHGGMMGDGQAIILMKTTQDAIDSLQKHELQFGGLKWPNQLALDSVPRWMRGRGHLNRGDTLEERLMRSVEKSGFSAWINTAPDANALDAEPPRNYAFVFIDLEDLLVYCLVSDS